MTVIPDNSRESVYMTSVIRSVTVVVAPGILSRIINQAHTGWPPVADGVIAEK